MKTLKRIAYYAAMVINQSLAVMGSLLLILLAVGVGIEESLEE